MNRILTGVCAVALSLGLLTACSESRTDRVGDRPADRTTPSASPPSATMPSTPPATSTPPSDSTSPSSSPSSPSSPSGTGTK